MKSCKMKRILSLLLIVGLCSTAMAGNTIMAWGFNTNGQCDVPEGSDYTDITAGSYHSAALKNDGTVVCWGLNVYGQCNAPVDTFKAISAKGHWTLGLKTDGSLSAWGNNQYGQCNVPAGTDFIDIAAGVRHGLALKSDGTVVAWGDNNFSQCKVPAGVYVNIIAAGMYSSYAVNQDGQIIAWGSNVYNLLNVPNVSGIKEIATGLYHNIALKADGTVAIWGSNVYGQFNLPAGSNYVAAVAGVFHSLALVQEGETTTLVAAGMNSYGQCIIPDGNNFYVKVAAGDYHNLALVKEPEIKVDIKVTPETLNLQSRGKFVTCKILASDAYDINQIDYDSLLLQGQLSPIEHENHRKHMKPFMHQRDVIDDGVVVMFSRDDLEKILEVGEAEIVLTGVFNDGKALRGTDTINVIEKFKEKKGHHKNNSKITEKARNDSKNSMNDMSNKANQSKKK